MGPQPPIHCGGRFNGINTSELDSFRSITYWGDRGEYVFFLACILVSARDVSLLELQQIVLNAIGSDKDIVEFFKSLSKEIAHDPEDKLDQVHRQIIMYLDKPSNRLRAHIGPLLLPFSFSRSLCFRPCTRFTLGTVQINNGHLICFSLLDYL